jgi:hypothetical protein
MLDGNVIRFAMAETDSGMDYSSASATIQIRPHPAPPSIVADWIGGYTTDGYFWQVGIYQPSTGPDATNPLQAFAWVTASNGNTGYPDDPLPLTIRPLAFAYPAFVAVSFDGTTLAAGGQVLGRLTSPRRISVLQVTRETWEAVPGASTGWCGVFRSLLLDGALPSFSNISLLPSGAATGRTPGYLVLRDVPDGPSACSPLGWP